MASGTRSGFSGGTLGQNIVAQSADSEQTGDPVDEVIAVWCSDGGDPRALASVRASILAGYANAIQTGAWDVGELVRAASNLMDRLGEGTVEPNDAVVAALCDAAGRLSAPTQAMEGSGIDELVERLDAYASGLTDFEFGEAIASNESVPAVPPLLTVRHDGVRVRPGAFEAAREGLAPRKEEPSAGEREGLAPRKEEPSAGEREGLAPRKEEPGNGPPNELPVLVDAWEAVGDYLRGHLETARSIAETNADPELRRLSIALNGVVETIERLNQTLAAYARRIGG